ncbi:hypothetical protein Tco_0355422 [Tanacetum coccineum]
MPMLNKDNYVPWSSHLLRYSKSKPNGKLIYNSIAKVPYVRRMIPEAGDLDLDVPVPKTFHEQTDDELTEHELKQNVGNQHGLIVVLGISNPNVNQQGNGNVIAARAKGNGNGNNRNQTDRAPVYDLDGSAEVHEYENCYNNEIFNTFTQEEQYTKRLEPIPEPHQVQQNDSNVIFVVFSVEQSGGIVEQHPTTIEETCTYFESVTPLNWVAAE